MKKNSGTRDEAEKAALVQGLQLEEQENQSGALRQHTGKRVEETRDHSEAIDEIESTLSDLWRGIGPERPAQGVSKPSTPWSH